MHERNRKLYSGPHRHTDQVHPSEAHTLIEGFGVEAGKSLNPGCPCCKGIPRGLLENRASNAFSRVSRVDGKMASVGQFLRDRAKPKAEFDFHAVVA